MRKAFEKIINAVDSAYDELVELLKKNNGFIDTQAKGLDNIYAIDYIGYEVIERKVLAVELNKEDNNIIIYVVPTQYAQYLHQKFENWSEHTNDDWNSFYNGESKGYWISLRNSEIAYIHTLSNIAEFINEYIKD